MQLDPTRTYLAGQWRRPHTDETFEDRDPWTGLAFARVANCTIDEAQLAIAAATAAQREWAAASPEQRARVFLRAAELAVAQSEALAAELVAESGSTLGKARFEIGYGAALMREAATQTGALQRETLTSVIPGKRSLQERVPAGVIAVITPWNFPFVLSLRDVCAALAYGNAVVLKPAEDTPITGGLRIARIFEEAGLPGGVLSVVPCSRDRVVAVTDALIEHPAVRRVSFTGSTAVGRSVGRRCGQHLKRALLELGGKDVLIVLRDADLPQAVAAAAFGAFFHQGQICMSVERILVEAPLAPAFAHALAEKARTLVCGDPRKPETAIGPLINARQLEKVRAHVERAVKDGAQALCGATHDGLVYRPTVLAGVTPRMDVARQETFGPVAPVLAVADAEEAIRIANDSEYGLSAGIFTADVEKGLAYARRIESGMAHVNDSSLHDEPHCPFGGVKASGMGRHGHAGALHEFTELRWLSVQETPRQYPI
jgi:acyl-CoA reductase-like NAD-dependent aldehyde dehydrogenase